MAKKEKRFTTGKTMVTDNGQLVNVLTDQKTGVQYLMTSGAGVAGVTVLVDKNGKPLLADATDE